MKKKMIIELGTILLVILIGICFAASSETDDSFYSTAEINVNNIQNTEQSQKVIWIEPNYRLLQHMNMTL